MTVFGQELLDEAILHDHCERCFCNLRKTMSPKQARLQLLTLASTMNDLQANVIEGIAGMLINMLRNPIADQGKFGKVDLQTQFYKCYVACTGSSVGSARTESRKPKNQTKEPK
ncbi:hypothetical protein F4703DRAFT_1936269 [Phycomyces blakesleeanus]